jgi:hypothetical protein
VIPVGLPVVCVIIDGYVQVFETASQAGATIAHPEPQTCTERETDFRSIILRGGTEKSERRASAGCVSAHLAAGQARIRTDAARP